MFDNMIFDTDRTSHYDSFNGKDEFNDIEYRMIVFSVLTKEIWSGVLTILYTIVLFRVFIMFDYVPFGKKIKL